MDKNQIKGELAAIQNELDLSLRNLSMATQKFSLVSDFSPLRTPPPQSPYSQSPQTPQSAYPQSPQTPQSAYPQSPQTPQSAYPQSPQSAYSPGPQYDRPQTPQTAPLSPEQSIRPVTAPPGVSGNKTNNDSFEVLSDDDLEDYLLGDAEICDTQGCRPFKPAGHRC